MEQKKNSRASYFSRNVGDYPEAMQFAGMEYEKVEDLRYGTNPHQAAAFYRPVGSRGVIGGMDILKSGKGGLSQTNLEDISYALNIVKFFDRSACACMKHVNPCGAATEAGDNEKLVDVYRKARGCDPRAAFGSVVAFNVEVGLETAEEILTTFVECVVAPAYTSEALAVFKDENRKRNRNIRIILCGDLGGLPRYVGEGGPEHRTYKVLHDGSMVAAEPLLTAVRGVDDLAPASAVDKEGKESVSLIKVSDERMADLVAAWYVNLNVRSNGVVIMKNGGTLAVGTGEQDRVGAVEQALVKFKEKYEGSDEISGSVMASDGFFPFPDAVETAAKAGISVIAAPAGSMRDAEVISRANELGVALRHAPERIFSHH